MNEEGSQAESRPCRHEKLGRCTNHFWRIMQRSGKPGLAEYFCELWRAKMEWAAAYRDAARRAHRFGLTGEKYTAAVQKKLAELPPAACPDFRPAGDDPYGPCRCYFQETCLLRYPKCPGFCEDYAPEGDQY